MDRNRLGSEEELADRVLSLLDINEQAERSLDALQAINRRLRQRVGVLERQRDERNAAFRRAIETVDEAEQRVADLLAENRTLRMALRGYSLPQYHRVDDPLSDGYGNVTEASTALSASTAPVAKKQLKGQ